MMARLTNDVAAVRMAAGPAIMYLTNTVAGAVFALVFMLRIDVKLTIIALLPMVALSIITAWLGGASLPQPEVDRSSSETLDFTIRRSKAMSRAGFFATSALWFGQGPHSVGGDRKRQDLTH